ncbi:response regulator transcription factor [Roseiconus lacunae]|uniref:ANTAR domain-containing response regulator n=1 Tax=Roseiconus lacunae TaxID=2605694 RepID=UPI00308D0F2E|nr:response regulator transcription factor [Stieleria sp. HD01]
MTKPLRILIADDEPEIRDFFRRFLPRLGHQVVGEAGDGQQLVNLWRSVLPDLVITDLAMPLLDGSSAVAQIGDEFPAPVIIVSSHDPPSAPVHRLIVSQLVKPVEREAIEEAIEKAILLTKTQGNESLSDQSET